MNITERIEQQAAQWLERREQPDWSDDDRATLDAWLDASIAHKLAYWRLEHGWTKVGRLPALRQVPPPGHLPLRRPLRLWKPVLAAASAAVFTVLSVAQPGSLTNQGKQTFDTTVGGHDATPRTDGSRGALSTTTQVAHAAP